MAHMNHTCPFCGGSELAITTERKSIVEHIMYWVRCLKCGAMGPWKTERAAAIGAWNTSVAVKRGASIGEDDHD